jgi:hypothetical protein
MLGQFKTFEFPSRQNVGYIPPSPLLITDTKLSNSEFNTSESLKSSELLKVDTAASYIFGTH